MTKNLLSDALRALRNADSAGVGSLASAVATFALLFAPISSAEQPARISGNATLALPETQSSEGQRYAITAAILPNASGKSGQSDAGGRFELNAKLTAHPNAKGQVTCGPIAPLIFRDGFE